VVVVVVVGGGGAVTGVGVARMVWLATSSAGRVVSTGALTVVGGDVGAAAVTSCAALVVLSALSVLVVLVRADETFEANRAAGATDRAGSSSRRAGTRAAGAGDAEAAGWFWRSRNGPMSTAPQSSRAAPGRPLF
jgi:hypothetical protein